MNQGVFVLFLLLISLLVFHGIFSYHPKRARHLYRREYGTVSIGAACMGRVAKTSPSCYGGGWERDTFKQGAVERVEACKRKKNKGMRFSASKGLQEKKNRGRRFSTSRGFWEKVREEGRIRRGRILLSWEKLRNQVLKVKQSLFELELFRCSHYMLCCPIFVPFCSIFC